MSDTVNPGTPGHEGSAGSHAPDGEQSHAVRFERDDIQAGPVVWFVVVLIIVTALTFVGVLVMMNLFNASEQQIKKTPWEVADAEQIKEQEGKELGMSVGPMPGDASAIASAASLVPMGRRNRSSIGLTPRLEGIDLHNPDDLANHLPEHSVGRIYPGAAAEQKKREEDYLASWAPYTNEGAPAHVPIEVAMRHKATASGPLPPDEWQKAPGRSSSGRVSRVPGADSATKGHDPAAKEQAEEGPKK